MGNEGHSYLHHMAQRHATLAPLTVFLPDTLWDDETGSKAHYTHDVVVRPLLGTRARVTMCD